MPDADTQPARILVVDDSPATREVLERHLRAEGHEVRTAESVAAAILALTEASADLVVTDMRMPGADGMDLVRHIREHHRGTGIIMVTGFATVGGAVSAMRQGVDDYLPKPFSDEELRCAVRTALDKVRLRRDLEARSGRTVRDSVCNSNTCGRNRRGSRPRRGRPGGTASRRCRRA